MSKISLVIDGQPVSAHPGESVLEAALAHGIDIPHLCYDRDLEPFGGCRLCIVEISGMKGLPASCTTEAVNGMVVSISSPELERVRRDTLELLLAGHPQDCLTCAAGRDCELQKVAAGMGAAGRTLRRLNDYRRLEELTPFFDIDRDYCILCQKCVRACDEVAHKNILAVVDRGARSRVVSYAGQEEKISACPDCLECVKRCPTAALKEKRWSRQGSFNWQWSP
jgi:NADH dehydrogenase/NADH:ubiquinone oxidoreductase subunit G